MIPAIFMFLFVATMPYWAPKLNNNNFHAYSCIFVLSISVISIIAFGVSQENEHKLLYEYNDLKRAEDKKKSDTFYAKEIEKMKNNN